MTLNDKDIRPALISKLHSQAIKPKAVMEELRVNNGNAIADVVALYKEAHCYEIKGENDKIERVCTQSVYYNTSFRKITLVTTQNHLKKALKIAPEQWGIIIAFYNKKQVRFRHVRASKANPTFNKELAIHTLWKSEMLGIIDEQHHHRKPREFLAKLISKTQKKSELSNNICKQLLNRYNSTLIKLDSH